MKAGPIRIAIDARPLGGQSCGYTIYLGSILQCLRRADFDVTLLSNRPIRPQYDEALGTATRLFGSLRNLRWEQIDLPRFLKENSFDIYFSGANRGIPLRKANGTRYLLGLLDIIPFLFFGDYYLRRWKTLLRHPSANIELLAQLIAIARADEILTISQQSARDIHRVFRRNNVTANLIRLKDVTLNAAPKMRQQFVYVGGLDARKKVGVLLRAFARLAVEHPDYRLVLIGSAYSALNGLIAELGLDGRVILTGYVDHDTKFRIISESRAMVYPSLYEGYGMAIAEGFQAGIPVIAGCGGSQEEVGGVGTRIINPCSAEDIASAMEEMLDPSTHAAWVERGQQQLKCLTQPTIETALIDYFTKQGALARQNAVSKPA